jgi:hypothetical protein
MVANRDVLTTGGRAVRVIEGNYKAAGFLDGVSYLSKRSR